MPDSRGPASDRAHGNSLDRAFEILGDRVSAISHVLVGNEGCDPELQIAGVGIYFVAARLPESPSPADAADELEELFSAWPGVQTMHFVPSDAHRADKVALTIQIDVDALGVDGAAGWLKSTLRPARAERTLYTNELEKGVTVEFAPDEPIEGEEWKKEERPPRKVDLGKPDLVSWVIRREAQA